MKHLLSTAVLLTIAVAFSSVASILPAYADEQRPSAAAADSGSANAASGLVSAAQSKALDASAATSESAPDDSAAASGQEKDSQHDDSSEEGETARPDGPSKQEAEPEPVLVSEGTASSKAIAANDVKKPKRMVRGRRELPLCFGSTTLSRRNICIRRANMSMTYFRG